MALTKFDLSAIRQVVKEETKPQFEKLNKKIDKIDGKFIKLFNFLDKDWSKLSLKVKAIERHLGFSTSEN